MWKRQSNAKLIVYCRYNIRWWPRFLQFQCTPQFFEIIPFPVEQTLTNARKKKDIFWIGSCFHLSNCHWEGRISIAERGQSTLSRRWGAHQWSWTAWSREQEMESQSLAVQNVSDSRARWAQYTHKTNKLQITIIHSLSLFFLLTQKAYARCSNDEMDV